MTDPLYSATPVERALVRKARVLLTNGDADNHVAAIMRAVDDLDRVGMSPTVREIDRAADMLNAQLAATGERT